MSINVGMVGTGFMAVAHLKAWAKVPGVRIAALCNPSGRNLDGNFAGVAGNVGDGEAFRLDMTGVKTFRDPAELFADPDIQVVDITTPTKTHDALTLAALAAGKHTLLEKPVAGTAAEARRIASAGAAAAARGVFLMPAHCLRFWPEWAWVRAAIADGRYGRVLSARFRRVAQPPAWGHAHFLDGAKSGGALFDLHIHDADFVQFCFGKPRSVFASGHTKVSGAIDHVLALYQVEGGATVSAEGSWAMSDGFGFNMAYTVNFERATADYDLARGAEALKLFVPGQQPEVLQPAGGDGYIGELTYFADCVRAGRVPRVVTANDGADAVALCEAEAESIRSGRLVTLA
jgi:predicted dehydrogenase